MASVVEVLTEMVANPQNVRFADACKVARHFFGEERVNGTSHHIWSMKWPGDPRVNLQATNGFAKAYQVKQLVAAVEKEKLRLETDAKDAVAEPEKPKPKPRKKTKKPKTGKKTKR